MGFEVSVSISAPAERIWAVLTDVERWPQWTPSMTSVQRLDEGPLAIGSQARIKQPRLPSMIWTVTALIPGRCFSWAAKRPGVSIVAGHVLGPETDGAVTVTLSVTASGAVGRLLEPLTARSAQRNVAMEANGLKDRSEGPVG